MYLLCKEFQLTKNKLVKLQHRLVLRMYLYHQK